MGEKILPGQFEFYPDEGCEVSPSCLTCPLSICKHDDPVGYRTFKQHQQWEALITEMEELGLSVQEAADRWGIVPRTVWRMMHELKKAKAKESGEGIRIHNTG